MQVVEPLINSDQSNASRRKPTNFKIDSIKTRRGILTFIFILSSAGIISTSMAQMNVDFNADIGNAPRRSYSPNRPRASKIPSTTGTLVTAQPAPARPSTTNIPRMAATRYL